LLRFLAHRNLAESDLFPKRRAKSPWEEKLAQARKSIAVSVLAVV
jgi:hypothetical protein